MADVKFNIESISEARRKVSEKKDELASLQKDLEGALEQLQTDWQTAAGKEFFSTEMTEWTQNVEKYKNALNIMEELLLAANQQYKRIIDATQQIRIE